MNTQVNSMPARLKAKMEEKNVSIQQLSNEIGVTYEMIRRYVMGTANPRLNNLEKIASYLNTTPSWLQFGIEESNNTKVVEQAIYLQDNINYLISKKNIPSLASIAYVLKMDEAQLQDFIDAPDLTNTGLINTLARLFYLAPERLLYDVLRLNPKGVDLSKWVTPSNTPIQTIADIAHQHRIDYLDVRLTAGMVGFEISDYPEIITSLWLSDDGLLELIGKRTADGIALVNVPTDSMEPTIQRGDVIFIDTNIKTYIGDGVYAFSIDSKLFVKRFQKLIKGGYKIISDNKTYDPEEMTGEEVDRLLFIGKFIRRWRIDSVEL